MPQRPKTYTNQGARRGIRGNARLNAQIANAKAAPMQEEADKLNSFGNLAMKTITGTPGAIGKIIKQTYQHPIRTAETIASGVYDEGIRPMANIPLKVTPWELPKTNFKPQNSVEEGMYKGFGVGGQAGAFYAGGAALRPLLESSKVTGLVAKYAPKLLTPTGTMRPFVQNLIGDQVLMQGLAEKDTPWKERAAMAATAPLVTLGLHGLGRGRNLATDRADESIARIASALGGKMTARELMEINLSEGASKLKVKLSDYQRAMRKEKGIMNPKTGAIDREEMIRQNLSVSAAEKRAQASTSSLYGKYVRPYIESGRGLLNRGGKSGKEFARRLDESYMTENSFQAFWKMSMKEAFEGIPLARREFITEAKMNPALRSQLRPGKEQKAYEMMQQFHAYVKKLGVKEKWRTTDAKGVERIWDDTLDSDTYISRYYTDAVKSTTTFKENEILGLMKQGLSRADAEGVYAAELERRLIRGRVGTLERARAGDDPRFIRDAGEIMDRYVGDVSRMKMKSDLFGYQNEKVLSLFSDMIASGKVSQEQIARIIDERLGQGEVPNTFIRMALKWNQFTKLSLAGVQNLTQAANTISVGGFFNTLKSIGRYATNAKDRAKMKDLARMAGALEDMLMEQETGLVSGKLMRGALYIFKKTEEFNRTIAADVGRRMSGDVMRALKANPLDSEALRAAKFLGLNVEEALKRGTMRGADVAKASYKFVTDTQFRMNALTLPLWSRTPMGKLFTQFKSFGYMQTTFWRDHIINEARQGNVKPLVRMLTVMPGLYLAAKKSRDVITLRDEEIRDLLDLPTKTISEEDDDIKKLEAAIGMTGMLPGQLFQSALYVGNNAFGEKSENRGLINRASIIAGNALGPTVSDIGGLVSAASQTDGIMKENRYSGNEGDPMRASFPIEKFFASKVPYVGGGVQNAFYKEWPKRESRIFSDNLRSLLTEYLQTNNEEILTQIKSQITSHKKKTVFSRVLAEVKREQYSPEDKAIYDDIQERKKYLNNLPYDQYPE